MSILDNINEVADGVAALTAAGNRLTEQGRNVERYGLAVQSSSDAWTDLTKSVKNASEAMATVVGGLAGMAGQLMGVEHGLTSMTVGATKASELMGELFGLAEKGARTLANAYDAPSREIRALDGLVFNLNKRFGGTVEAASKFSQTMLGETNTQFSRSLYITRTNLNQMAEAAIGTQLTLEQLNETVQTTRGETSLLAAAYAFSAASGMRSSEVMSTLDTIINKQGVAASEATKMLGLYAGTSQSTGLTIDKVSKSLNSAVANFSKLGASADFGRPALEGFARVVRDMGLGIDEADRLAQNFSASLLGLATDYSSAFVVQQRSGMDFGAGGGALGASIGLQSELLKAEETGDQSVLAAQLAGAMKDTLSSFGGGNIVTVSEAAESPELQSQFYTQQQLLMNQFGLRDQGSANRTLEYLQGLEEATRTGNADAQREFETLIQNEKDGRDELLDNQQKVLAELMIQSDLMAMQQREEVMKIKDLGDAAFANYLRPFIIDQGENFRGEAGDAIAAAESGLDALLGAMGMPVDIEERNRIAQHIVGQGASMPGVGSASSVNAEMRLAETGPEVIARELNRLQAQTAQVESLDELIAAASSLEGGPLRGAEELGVEREEYMAAFKEILKDFNNQQNVNIEIQVRDDGRLQAFANIAKQVGEQTAS